MPSRLVRRVILLAAPVALAVAAVAVFGPLGPAPSVPPAPETFVYRSAGGCELRADVFRAEGAGPRPALLWLHGGGLVFGSRRMLPAEHLARYRAAGFTVVAADYRLAPETPAAGAVADAAAALGWMRQQAATLGIDPGRVGVVGHSAGAFLALQAGQAPAPPAAVVAWYGYGDLSGAWARARARNFGIGPVPSRRQAEAAVRTGCVAAAPDGGARYNLYGYLRYHGRWAEALGDSVPPFAPGPAYPPALLIHGTIDGDVPYAEAERVRARLAAAGVPHRLVTAEGRGHAFDLRHGLADPPARDAFEAALHFLIAEVSDGGQATERF